MIGTVVEEEGRRGQIFEYTGKFKGKPRKRQRKATNELPEVHPDAREAFESFQGSLSVDADT